LKKLDERTEKSSRKEEKNVGFETPSNPVSPAKQVIADIANSTTNEESIGKKNFSTVH